MKAKLIEHRALAALLVIFLILGGIYSIATPIFEAGDELWHYPFVQFLATGHGLPIQDPAHKDLWEQEGGQPPLYYALSAAATFWIDTRDLTERLWRNPYARIGIPLAFGNKNMVVHTRAEDFPWHNTTLAVHLIRFLSIILSVSTVAFTFFLAREIRVPNPLLAAAFVAFNPMFLFISASVNNDSLATMLAALALLLIVQLVTRGADTRRLLVLGIVCGLGALTKISDLALTPLALLVVVWLACRARDARLLVRGALWIGVPVSLIAGWWYARNYFLYGDPFAFNVWLQIAGGRPPVTLLGLLNEFQGFRISFWGNFGGVNLIASEWVYTALDIISLLALLGLILGAWKRKLPRVLVIPTLWLVLICISLIRWTLMTYASQGRLIFPAISAIGILLAYGLSNLRLKKLNPLPTTAIVFLFSFALATPFFIIAPAYALPPRLNTDAPVPNPVHITYDARGARPELVGYEIGRAAHAGEELPLTLYWQTTTPVTDDLYVYIHLYDAGGKAIGQWDALPGNGLYPARLWQPNELIVDRYRVPLASTVVGTQAGWVEVGLTRIGESVPLVAHDPNGIEASSTRARFKIPAARVNADARPALFKLGEVFDLTDIHLNRVRDGAMLRAGDVIQTAFTLRAQQQPSENYTIFVHLVSPQGITVAQTDIQPLQGDYPTLFWDAGEAIADQLELRIPPDAPAGNYQIEFGLYQPDGARLPLIGAARGNWRAVGDHLLYAPLRVGK